MVQTASPVPFASKEDHIKHTLLEKLCMESPIQWYLPVVTHRNQKADFERLRKQNKCNLGINLKRRFFFRNFSIIFHHCTIVWSISCYLETESTPSDIIIQNCCFLMHTYTQRRECLLRLSEGDVQNADTRGQGCIQIYWGGHNILGIAPGVRRNSSLTHWSTSPCPREWHIHTQRCPSRTELTLRHCQGSSIFHSLDSFLNADL